MKKITTTGLFIFSFNLLFVSQLMAINNFVRSYEIPIPEDTLNIGGVGNIISGVDLDEDGALEIYMVNSNWADRPQEITPRIYKLEQQGTDWPVVWQAVAPVDSQGTWPPLVLTDLDGDGKDEITWFIVNELTDSNQNPFRIVVYEEAGDGSDVMGVDDGTGSYKPNSAWRIIDENSVELRPASVMAGDVDNDGKTELIFADRKGNNSGFHFCVASVDEIPDDAHGLEMWTVESSGRDFTLSSQIDNKWDAAVLGNNMYFFDESEISKLSWDGSSYQYSSMMPLPGGISFNSVQVVDLDNDGNLEMVTGEYRYGDPTRHLWLLQEDGDTLKHTALFDVNGIDMLNGGRIFGGAHGDLDQDGYPDLVFGSYLSGPPNAMIFRLAYRGGDITDSTNYELTLIDTGIVESGSMWGLVNIADIDDDPEMEVLYTARSSVNDSTGSYSYPIVVLDYDATASIESGYANIPSNFYLDQNYPNPFNPITTIQYELSKQSEVQITIYDLLGKKVTTLVSETQDAGFKSIQWNASNAASGVYFYQIRTGDFNQTRKMILLK